ncbi:hypothetical protein BDP55DRAFT_627559 [Colletotrichum godetiae]|uniref:Uncharacterized protein n=1 Tax=Colletotrichum godetiae TaxID=1209918 RepID=A0AAJ0AV30_9PEZI|nr:uncharacterized protein BDP55DRAFT_627559 [Colletotrichum godetiae]KAK1690870.1 hypothetical protein BDP55DRAFT_627559 [Colletotrichum godetiae]
MYYGVPTNYKLQPPKPVQVQSRCRCSRCTSPPPASCLLHPLPFAPAPAPAPALFTDSLFGFASPSTAVIVPACLSVPSARSNHETSFDIFLVSSRYNLRCLVHFYPQELTLVPSRHASARPAPLQGSSVPNDLLERTQEPERNVQRHSRLERTTYQPEHICQLCHPTNLGTSIQNFISGLSDTSQYKKSATGGTAHYRATNISTISSAGPRTGLWGASPASLRDRRPKGSSSGNQNVDPPAGHSPPSDKGMPRANRRVQGHSTPGLSLKFALTAPTSLDN